MKNRSRPLIWRHKIEKVIFVNKNCDQIIMNQKVDREYFRHSSFVTERKRLERYGRRKHGQGTKVILQHSERSIKLYLNYKFQKLCKTMLKHITTKIVNLKFKYICLNVSKDGLTKGLI